MTDEGEVRRDDYKGGGPQPYLGKIGGVPAQHVLSASCKFSPLLRERECIHSGLQWVEERLKPQWQDVVTNVVDLCRRYRLQVDTLLNTLEILKFSCVRVMRMTPQAQTVSTILITEIDILVALGVSSKVSLRCVSFDTTTVCHCVLFICIYLSSMTTRPLLLVFPPPHI